MKIIVVELVYFSIDPHLYNTFWTTRKWLTGSAPIIRGLNPPLDSAIHAHHAGLTAQIIENPQPDL